MISVVGQIGIIRGGHIHHDDVTAGGAKHDVSRHVVDITTVHQEVAVHRVTDRREQPGVAHAGSHIAPHLTCL